jgi:hypothetical protein
MSEPYFCQLVPLAIDMLPIPDTIDCVEIWPQKIRRIARSYLWAILIWVGFAPVMAGQDKVRLLERGQYTAYWNLLLANGAWCLSAALLTPPIFSIVRRYPITKQALPWRVAGYFFATVPYVIGAACVRWIVLPPWDSAAQRFGPRTLTGLIHSTYIFADLIWDYFIILAAAHAYEYFTRARNQEVERAELQQALAASELQALKSQLQPHFLFNTLHGISTLIDADKARAKAMVLKLSNLLRTALQYGNSDLIALDEELKFAEAYLDIEKMRLNGRLEVRWKIQPDTRQLLVPQLILQPLVENAIVHGIACSREGGWLEITSRRSEGQIELNIRNSVRGKDQSGLGLGLRNTKVRLKYLYSDEAVFSFAVGEDRVATAMLLLPALGTQKPELAEEAAGGQPKGI